MHRNKFAVVAACGILVLGFLGLGACTQLKPTGDAYAAFFVTSAGHGTASGYLPTGYGWTPGSKVAISIWHEPNGPSSVSSDWRHLFDETVDSYVYAGTFGYNGGAPFYAVQRTICGNPEPGQTVAFMARSLTTGRTLIHWVSADLYFTYRPCP